MNLAQALEFVASAFADLGSPLTDSQKALLSGPVRQPEELSAEDRQFVFDAKIAVMDRLVRMGLTGAACGSEARITSYFGRSLEQNYGHATGPFLDLARTYWTFKLEVADLDELAPTPQIIIPLGLAEQSFASVFFPTPGPAMVPVTDRREGQRQILESHWPPERIAKFLEANPILVAETRRQSAGCLPAIVAIIVSVAILGIVA